MLMPEMKKLKDYLEGGSKNFDEEKLLKELKILENKPSEYFKSINESLSMSSGVCPTCGRKV